MSEVADRMRQVLLARADALDGIALAPGDEARILREAAQAIRMADSERATDSAIIDDLRAKVKRITGERGAARAEIERLQDDVASLRHEVTRLQSLASTAADLLEIEEIKREIMEAGAHWKDLGAWADYKPIHIYPPDDGFSKAFGTKGQPATLADWHAALAWLRGVTAPKPETEPKPERLSEPIDTMSSERCAEVAAEARLARGAMVDADAKSWIAVWIDSGGEFSCRRGLMSEAAASRYSLVKAADARALIRHGACGEHVLLPPANEEGAG